MNLLTNDPSLHNRTTLVAADITHLVHLCVKATVFTSKRNGYQWALPSPRCQPASSWNGLKTQCSSLLPSSQLSGGDDTFVLLERSSVPQFHAHSNNQEESIIFTKEEKDEQQLPFLDCLISRTPDGGFMSKVYRKPTATDRFLRFDSHHPLTVKRGLIKCLTTRARKLCSTEESEKAEIRHISKALQCNNYPRHFIQKCIHRTNPSSERQWITSIKLLYEPRTDEAIKRILQRAGIRVFFNSLNTIGRFLGNEKDNHQPRRCSVHNKL